MSNQTTSQRDYQTVQEIRDANEAAGHFWFSPHSMRFFGSRILSGVYGGRYFVTSEKRPDSSDPRLYSVRVVRESGAIDTVGKFQGYQSASAARAAARKLAKFPPLSDLQARALYWFCAQNGGSEEAREILTNAWWHGKALAQEVDGVSVSLYALRNSHGPAWLDTLRLCGVALSEV